MTQISGMPTQLIFLTQSPINKGAIFPAENSTEEGMVRLAIDRINADPSLLPNYEIDYIGNYTGVLADFESIQKGASQFHSTRF